MYSTIGVMVLFFVAVKGSQIIAHRPMEVDACNVDNCPPLREPCIRTFIPPGNCCPVCACRDNDRSYYVGQSFKHERYGSPCVQCKCKRKGSLAVAHCFHAFCAVSHGRKERGKCCPIPVFERRTFPPIRRFPPINPRTFPPFPKFPAFPGKREDKMTEE